MALSSAIHDIFNQETSADKAQERIEALLKDVSVLESLKLWIEIFNSSDSLGKTKDTAPMIRGRAGEMMVVFTIKYLQQKSKSFTRSRMYHSFHFNGTEQDILLLTDRCIYLIEVKSTKSSNFNNMENKTGKKGVSQNDMHVDRFDSFLEKELKYRYAVPIETYLVYVMSDNSDKASIVDGTTLLPAQKLFRQLCDSYYIKHKTDKVRDFDYLLSLFHNYQKSGKALASEKEHKRRLGYE